MQPDGPLADRYLLGDLLGRGGMADVHRARDLRLDREVAVKVLRDGSGPEARTRFRDEASVLARLSHPSLVTLLDADVGADARSFLVVELVDGPTLRRALFGGPLPARRVAAIGAQLAAGLAHAHEHGVAHLDVKPSNILLGGGGNHSVPADDRARLVDFGIARVLGESLSSRPGQPSVGTAAYLSPEQVLGADAGSASDVYALGIVLLEALTGAHPYPGPAAASMAARLHHSPVVRDELGAPWVDLLRSMTARDPADRPRAAVVAAALADAASAPAPARRLPRRRVVALAASTVVTAVVVGAGLVLGVGDEPAPPPVSPPKQAAR